jgi:predicted transcriptional regulator
MTTETAAIPTTQSSLELVVEIVSAYISNNTVATADLPAVISSIHNALTHAGSGADTKAAEAAPLSPAVPIRKSIFPDYIVCLEDGKKLKMLKRHLSTAYNMTPDQYRAKWKLPHDYPMVAPNYAQERSALARSIGLGRRPVAAPEPPPAPVPVKPARRGRAAAK